MMSRWLHRKSINISGFESHQRLTPTMSWWHLIALGVGAVVGTGIYTLIGVGANLAGPSVILSFLIAGSICICAALAYAEVASMIPASGSAYTYSYVALGEVFAWVVGWSLILEYSLVVSAVAVGWSGYATGFLESFGIHVPLALAAAPHAGGVFNLPAMIIVGIISGLLCFGTKESATINAILVIIKISALMLFLFVALPYFNSDHFIEFMPYGFTGENVDGVQYGVMAAAAIIFFAFYGFDAISTAAEETRDPGRSLPIGIIGSLVICMIIYVAIAVAAIGSMDYTVYAKSAEPLTLILRELHHRNIAAIVGAAAVIALPTVILAFLYGQSRIFFVMARDGLLPRTLAKVSARTDTPIRITLLTAAVVSVLAGLLPLDEIAALANTGTLVAFIAVSTCMLVMRRRNPDRDRVFRTPFAWVVGPTAIMGCLYLFWSLPSRTHHFFLIWNIVGIIVYLAWSRRTAKIGVT